MNFIWTAFTSFDLRDSLFCLVLYKIVFGKMEMDDNSYFLNKPKLINYRIIWPLDIISIYSTSEILYKDNNIVLLGFCQKIVDFKLMFWNSPRKFLLNKLW